MSKISTTSDSLTVDLTGKCYADDRVEWDIRTVEKRNSGGYAYEDTRIIAEVIHREGDKQSREGRFALDMDPHVFTGLVKTIINEYYYQSREDEFKKLLSEIEAGYAE